MRRYGFLFVLMLLPLFGGPVRAEPSLASLGKQASESVGVKADLVVVYKSKRRLYLMKDGETLKSYYVALGFNPEGHKAWEGDGRTPEGRYVLDWRNPDSRFHRSIHVSYPNLFDRVKALNLGVPAGGMIMIHGAPNNPRSGVYGVEADWTNGCLAVNNEAMDEIWASVDDGTPIEIHP